MSREQSFAERCGVRRRGRPRGSRNKATLALEAVLEGAAEELTRMLIAKALAGDWPALRFCVGLLLPARRDRPVVFDLPPIESAGDLVKAGQAVVAACAEGVLSPREATQVMNLVTSARALVEGGRFETRLVALEKRQHASAAKTSCEEAAPCYRRAPPPARVVSGRREALGVSGREIEKGRPARRRVACKSPVFNSTTRLVGSARSPVAAKRLLLCAARSCPRGAPSILPARPASRGRRAFGVSACEIEKGISAPSRVACKSPVFNSTTRLVGWARSPVAADGLARVAPAILPTL